MGCRFEMRQEWDGLGQPSDKRMLLSRDDGDFGPESGGIT